MCNLTFAAVFILVYLEGEWHLLDSKKPQVESSSLQWVLIAGFSVFFFHEENSKFPFVLELGYLFLRDLRVYLISVVHCLATSVSNGIRSLRAVSFLSLYQLFIAIPLSVCKRKFSGTLSTIKTLLRSLPILLRSLIYTPKLKLVCYLYNLCLIVLLLSNMSNTLRNTKS